MTHTTTTLASIVAAPLLFAAGLQHAAPEAAGGAAVQSGSMTILETAEAAGDFDTLLAAVDAAGLTAALDGPGPFTVFAPTDAAFAALPPDRLVRLLAPPYLDELTDILTFHVVAGALDATAVTTSPFLETVNGQRAYVWMGAGPMIEDAQIVVTDIQCSNGIIHVIDAVLLPELRSIVQVAANLGRFNTLAAALGAADLVDTLQGPGPFTVFAPTDDAFAALPPGALDALLADPAALTDTLLFHVAAGRLYADQVVPAGMLDMLNGDTADISVTGGSAFIENARILVTDVQTRNGVIHVIDAVLLP